jgi:hypothetical protein
VEGGLGYERGFMAMLATRIRGYRTQRRLQLAHARLEGVALRFYAPSLLIGYDH